MNSKYLDSIPRENFALPAFENVHSNTQIYLAVLTFYDTSSPTSRFGFLTARTMRGGSYHLSLSLLTTLPF